MQLLNLLLCATLGCGVLAHPGEDIRAELQKREAHLANPQRRTLKACRRELENSGYYHDKLAKRMARANTLRAEQGRSPVQPRDIDPILGADAALGPRDESADAQERAECVLDPEVTEGPYWVSGEYIRSNLLEGGRGVKLHLDINVIDTTTCLPLPDVYVELWGCNATGVYSGVVSSANGNGLAAPEEINNTALRGLQLTDSYGTVSFITLVPGHYINRTHHLHTIVHHGATKLPNNTIQGGTISHVGQFYLEPEITEAVEKTAPYTFNTQPLTTNDQDEFFPQGTVGGDNPIIKVTMLGDTIASGLYGFIDVGVDPSAVKTPSQVNYWSKDGGIPNENSPWKGFPWTSKKIRSLFRI